MNASGPERTGERLKKLPTASIAEKGRCFFCKCERGSSELAIAKGGNVNLNRVLTTATCGLMIFLAPSFSWAYPELNAVDAMRAMQASDMQVVNFVSGVIHGLNLANDSLENSHRRKLFCGPSGGVKIPDAIGLVIAVLEADQKVGPYPVSILILGVLQKSFPCPSD